ncbi:hypothetical protein SPI_05216 [Niveomyces insectorum RCEF 264]|uniref:Uncharacterized protein n=1 Tax=Niveomyces insectorum RCEF 264 TaxID=1081102 RepID=A0A167U2X1_9HYPO|nr:hypothetical protein SPI_05216 [Niveomyces insectorum RCEF 264]
MSTNSKVESAIEKIKKQQEAVAQSRYQLSPSQCISLDTAVALLEETEESLQKRSTQQQGRRRRVRNFLLRVADGLGVEPAFLCMLSLPITTLAEVQLLLYNPLARWWETAEKHSGLRDLASRSFPKGAGITNSLETSTASAASLPKKRPFSEVVGDKNVDGRDGDRKRDYTESADGDEDVDEDDDEDGHENEDEDQESDDGRATEAIGQLPDARLTGKVYQLSDLEAIRVICNNEHPQILLTVPVLHEEGAAFITIRIARRDSMEFLTELRRGM